MKASCQSRLNCKYRAAGSCWDIRCNRIFKARQASFKITVSRLTSQEASHHLSIKKWLHKRPVSKQISTLINKRISFHSLTQFSQSLLPVQTTPWCYRSSSSRMTRARLNNICQVHQLWWGEPSAMLKSFILLQMLHCWHAITTKSTMTGVSQSNA